MDINQYKIHTPEGISLNLKLAGLWPRAAAWMIDFIIRILAYIALSIALSFLGYLGTGVMLISIFILEYFYPIFYEVFNNGMTPGKKRLDIQVLNMDGTRVGWKTSFIRNLLRTVDIMPIFYGVGMFSLLLSKCNQRIGDLAAQTIVVYKNDALSALNQLPASTGNGDHLPLVQQLNREEKNAFISYAERFNELSAERREELAAVLQPYLDRQGLETSPQQLVNIANNILGAE